MTQPPPNNPEQWWTQHQQPQPPPPYQYAPAPPQGWLQKNSKLVIALLIVAGILLFALLPAINNAFNGSGSTTYTVTGDGVISTVTYSTSQGSQQDSNVGMGWSVTVDTGATASVVAQAGATSSTITCTIKEGGEVVASQTSSGGYAVVSCTH